jgi:hypothetical protein
MANCYLCRGLAEAQACYFRHHGSALERSQSSRLFELSQMARTQNLISTRIQASAIH